MRRSAPTLRRTRRSPLKAYDGLTKYAHQTIDHADTYVRGNVHTYALENFWPLLKRAIKGTYVDVEAFDLLRYLDEDLPVQ